MRTSFRPTAKSCSLDPRWLPSVGRLFYSRDSWVERSCGFVPADESSESRRLPWHGLSARVRRNATGKARDWKYHGQDGRAMDRRRVRSLNLREGNSARGLVKTASSDLFEHGPTILTIAPARIVRIKRWHTPSGCVARNIKNPKFSKFFFFRQAKDLEARLSRNGDRCITFCRESPYIVI